MKEKAHAEYKIVRLGSFENLVKEGDASWTVSGTDTSFTTITVSAGTLDAALVLSDNAVEVLNTSIVTGQIDLGGGSNVITNALNWRAQVTAGDGDDRAINSGVIHDISERKQMEAILLRAARDVVVHNTIPSSSGASDDSLSSSSTLYSVAGLSHEDAASRLSRVA